MSELHQARSKLKFTTPSPRHSSNGLYFMGKKPMTQEDYDAFKAFNHGQDFEVDPLTVVGRFDRSWSYHAFEIGETDWKPGGEGSSTYETKKLGSGVYFRDRDETKEIWHINPDGDRVHGVLNYPRTGRAFHKDRYGTTVAGPKPGSKAAQKLRDGSYVWDEEEALWKIEH